MNLRLTLSVRALRRDIDLIGLNGRRMCMVHLSVDDWLEEHRGMATAMALLYDL